MIRREGIDPRRFLYRVRTVTRLTIPLSSWEEPSLPFLCKGGTRLGTEVQSLNIPYKIGNPSYFIP